MTFTTGSTLLDAIVLASVAQEKDGLYGYKITQNVRSVLDVSESALYPVLRRLQTSGFLETYDQPFNGRNRRYYKITSQGNIQLDNYRSEWQKYCSSVNDVLFGKK